MPKPSTLPTLYDHVCQISISNLRRWGYLAPDCIKNGVLRWSWQGETTAKISFYVDTIEDRPYIELNYRANGEPRRYKVYLVCVPSNLRRGRIWYFLCPVTGKRARKLYCVGGYFLHRAAFTGCMYECQTQAKRHRDWNHLVGAYFELDRVYMELHKPYFKQTYAGKPTKKYLRIAQKIERGKRVPDSFAENAFLYI